MKILFIGGTGRLSKDVAKYALEQNHEVYLITRGSKNRARFIEQGYHMLHTDIRDISASKECIKGMFFDVVIDFLSFNTEHMKCTLEIIEGCFTQYIFISSATVYNPKEGEVISEESTSIGNDKWSYAYEKYQCEKYVEEYFEDKKSQHYTIVRPYVTYGNTRVPYPLVPRDALKEWSLLNRIVCDKAIPVLDMEPITTTLLHTRDFAKGLVGLCLNKEAYGEDFHITNNITTTWETVLDILADITEHEIKKIRVSKEEIYKYMPEYTGVLEGDKTREMRFDNSKICSVVPGYCPSVDLEAGLREMFSFYIDNPDLQLIDREWDWRINKICKETNSKLNKIVIYGAGNYGKRFYRFLDSIGVKVHCFCQSEVPEGFCSVYETPIIAYQQLMNYEDVKIIFIAIADENISELIKTRLESAFSKKVQIIDVNKFLKANHTL